MNSKLLAVAALLTLGAIGIAHAQESDDAGYNTSNGDTLTIGTDSNTGGEAPGDAQQMDDIQSGMQDMKERWSGDAQRNAVENGQ